MSIRKTKKTLFVVNIYAAAIPEEVQEAVRRTVGLHDEEKNTILVKSIRDNRRGNKTATVVAEETIARELLTFG